MFGVGKSIFIDVFGLYVFEKGGKLVVLVIDFSSECFKGSILGDKICMEKLFVYLKFFIWFSLLVGLLGGVVCKICEMIIFCEVVGFDKIFVEMVGVG